MVILQTLKKRQRYKKEGGFTLVELMVVVAVIAILASIALPQFLGAGDKAQKGKVQADMRVIKNAAQLYLIDNPSAQAPTIETLVNEGYLNEAVKNPQKNDYQISITTAQDGKSKTITVEDPDHNVVSDE